MQRHFIIVILVTLILIAGCNPVAEKSSVESFMNEYFGAIKNKDLDRALGFYSPQFFEKTSRESWKQSLQAVNSKLGDLQKFETTEWQIKVTTGLGSSGTSYIFKYRVTYSKYPASEEVILFRAAGSTEIKILQHHITSEGFFK